MISVIHSTPTHLTHPHTPSPPPHAISEPIQATWCAFEGIARALCVVEATALTVHSKEGEVFEVPLPFRVCAVYPLRVGVLVYRQQQLQPNKQVWCVCVCECVCVCVCVCV